MRVDDETDFGRSVLSQITVDDESRDRDTYRLLFLLVKNGSTNLNAEIEKYAPVSSQMLG